MPELRMPRVPRHARQPLVKSTSRHARPAVCASTNHSHLSMPRETSVNRSAVSRSPSSLASSMAFRAACRTPPGPRTAPRRGCGRPPPSPGIRPATTALRHHPGRALGDAAELHRPLGDVVHVVLDVLVDLVEQLVQGDEVRPLDVPVGLLGLRLQVDAVGQPGVEQLDHLDAGASDRSFFVRPRAGRNGRARGGRARCNGSRVSSRKTIWSSQASAR